MNKDCMLYEINLHVVIRISLAILQNSLVQLGNLESCEYCANQFEKPSIIQIVNLQIPRQQQQQEKQQQQQAREKSTGIRLLWCDIGSGDRWRSGDCYLYICLVLLIAARWLPTRATTVPSDTLSCMRTYPIYYVNHVIKNSFDKNSSNQ